MRLLNSIGHFALFPVVFIVMLAFTGTVFAQSPDESDSSFDSISGQLVVSVEDQTSLISVQTVDDIIRDAEPLKQKGFKIVDALLDDVPGSVQAMSLEFKRHIIDHMGLVYLVEYPIADYKDINVAKNELKNTLENAGLEVRYVQENYTMKALEAAPQAMHPLMHPNQGWHYNMINAPQAWDITTGSNGVRIAVLDTGIDSNHSSLRNLVNSSLGRSFVGGNTNDVHGHGTHVAGTIASYGSVSGVMHSATLIPVKVLDDTGYGSMYGIQQGVVHAANIGADVINMSLGGGGHDRGMEEAINAAVSSGALVVAATGNDGAPSLSYPAAYNNSIAVGSVSSNQARSYLSNYGQGLDVMAPGDNIYSTLPGNRYGSMSGTSMATPHVAGVLGLMKAANPNLSVSQAKAILKNTAQPAGPVFQYGSGIVDAYAAVQESGGGGSPQPPEKKSMTEVSTNKSIYRRGDNIVITATVSDEKGARLQGANVSFELTRPNGTKLNESTNTNAQGVATWTLSSNEQTLLGTFSIKATTTMSEYESSSDTVTIQFTQTGNGDDTEPPTVPTNLRETSKSSTSVSLSWNASTDNVGVTGYQVYNGSTLVTTVTGTTATISNLTPDTSYTFTVRAVDATGNISQPSNSITVTTDSDSTTPPETDWDTYVNYSVGDEVTYHDVTYVCQIAHTSLPGWEPANVPALWVVK